MLSLHVRRHCKDVFYTSCLLQHFVISKEQLEPFTALGSASGSIQMLELARIKVIC